MTPSPTGTRRGALVAYAGAILLALVPLVPTLWLRFVPTVDGPAHVLEAWVITNYGSADAGLLRKYYELSAAPSPNLLTELLLVGLLQVVPPTAAEKLLAAGAVALFAVGFTYAARSVDRRGSYVAALGVPFATGYLFWFGFYNFAVGTGLALVTLGVLWRRAGNWTPASTAGVAVLLLLTASAHLLPFAVVALAMGLGALFDVRRATGADGDRVPATVAIRRHLLPPVLALLVPAALCLLFVARSASVRTTGDNKLMGSQESYVWGLRFIGRVIVGQLAVAGWDEFVLSVLLLAVVGSLLVTSARRLRHPPRGAVVPLSLVAACVLLFVVVPDAVGALAYIKVRFAFFALLCLLLTLAAVPPTRRVRVVVTTLACVLVAGLTIARWPEQQQTERDLVEYSSEAAVMRPGSTFVTFRPGRMRGDLHRAGSIDPVAHQASRVAIATRTVQLNHLDARYDYFPARFRERDHLGARTTDLTTPIQWLAMLSAEDDKTGTGPDYVLVWGRSRADPAERAEPAWAEAMDSLALGYRKVSQSSPRGLLEVYQRR